MASEEPVTSPDQHKPTPIKAARIVGVIAIVMMLLMTIGNHEGRVEDLWLLAIAGVMTFILVSDIVLRRNGLR